MRNSYLRILTWSHTPPLLSILYFIYTTKCAQKAEYVNMKVRWSKFLNSTKDWKLLKAISYTESLFRSIYLQHIISRGFLFHQSMRMIFKGKSCKLMKVFQWVRTEEALQKRSRFVVKGLRNVKLQQKKYWNSIYVPFCLNHLKVFIIRGDINTIFYDKWELWGHQISSNIFNRMQRICISWTVE